MITLTKVVFDPLSSSTPKLNFPSIARTSTGDLGTAVNFSWKQWAAEKTKKQKESEWLLGFNCSAVKVLNKTNMRS